jgi:hypothetical protein
LPWIANVATLVDASPAQVDRSVKVASPKGAVAERLPPLCVKVRE